MFETKSIVEIAEYIRFWLGNIGENIISEVDLLRFIQKVIDTDSEYTGCDVTYYSTVEVLRWLVRKQDTGTSIGSGEIVSRKDKIADVSVEVTYDTGTSSSDGYSGWSTVLNNLIKSPDIIGCAITPVEGNVDSGKIVFGGVSQAEVDRVNSDPDSKNGYSLNSPFRSHLTVNTKLIG